jgi:hypothetical protein
MTPRETTIHFYAFCAQVIPISPQILPWKAVYTTFRRLGCLPFIRYYHLIKFVRIEREELVIFTFQGRSPTKITAINLLYRLVPEASENVAEHQ